jgi:hypothetical protein
MTHSYHFFQLSRIERHAGCCYIYECEHFPADTNDLNVMNHRVTPTGVGGIGAL